MYDVVGSNTGDISHIMGKNVTPQNFSFRCEYLLEYIYPSSKFFEDFLEFSSFYSQFSRVKLEASTNISWAP